jgi:hypothetical protein
LKTQVLRRKKNPPTFEEKKSSKRPAFTYPGRTILAPIKGGFTMKRILAVVAIIGLFSSVAFAGAIKTYQVTGPVLEVTSDMVAVKKGSDRWEIALGPDTKVTGDLKVGSKVTIEYRMTATKVDVKEAAKAKGTPKTKTTTTTTTQ